MAGKSNAAKGKARTTPGNERAPFVGYVNVSLTDKDKEGFESWFADSDLFAETYVEALASGYQFTTKFDTANESYSCSVSTWDVGKSDAGIIYTGRSSDPAVALAKALYTLAYKLNWDLANGYVKHAHVDAF